MDNDVTRKSCSFCGVPGSRGQRFAGGLGAMMCESCVEHYHAVFSSAEESDRASRPPWESMSDTELLGNIPRISANVDQVGQFLVDWVELARSRKISWAAIGKALGVSRQAAWERFAPRMDLSSENRAAQA